MMNGLRLILSAALGLQARGATPEEFTRFLQEETAKWGDLVKKANIKAAE